MNNQPDQQSSGTTLPVNNRDQIRVWLTLLALILAVVLSSLFERHFGIAFIFTFTAIFGVIGLALLVHGFKFAEERFFYVLGGVVFGLIAAHWLVTPFDSILAHKLANGACYIIWGLLPLKLFQSYRKRRKIVDPMAS